LDILLGFGIVVVGLSALCCISVCVFLFITSTLTAVRSIASLYWPVVDGLIVDCKIHEETGTYRDSESGMELSSVHYRPIISYTYEFCNFLYRSDRISFADNSGYGTRKSAEKTVAKYQSGMKVRVRCNPRKPEQSVLKPGLKATTIVTLLLSLFFLSYLVVFIPVSILKGATG
jgi:hypothetical protein